MKLFIFPDSFNCCFFELTKSFENLIKSYFLGMFVLTVFSILSTKVVAQWNNSTDQNTIVYEGGISKSKIVSGSNFYYVSTFRIVPGGCIPYLYKISFDGHMEWPEGGLMINNINQPSELTSYDIKVDVNDNAIVVFRNESLSQQEQYITINKISPEGEFLWGETGIKFDIVGAMEFKPVLCLNPDSSVTMMTNLYRSNPNKPDFQVALMRYSSDGNGLWGTAPRDNSKC
ncbi:MAG: hypothetical protein J7L96_09690 [Bacteroidales bacterium]|nr:hypothetical protein [Bacteroidales bacterium]